MKNPYLIFMGLGFELIGVILGCLWVGSILDSKFGWGGLGVVSCSILGLVGWFIHLLQLLKMVEKNTKE